MIRLLENEMADVEGDDVLLTSQYRVISVWATDFGSGSVKLQASPDGGTSWINLKDTAGFELSFSSNTIQSFANILARDMKIRAVLTGSTSPDSVNVALHEYLI